MSRYDEMRETAWSARMKEIAERRKALEAVPSVEEIMKDPKSFASMLESLDASMMAKEARKFVRPDPKASVPLNVEGLRLMIMNLSCPQRAPKDLPEQCSLTGTGPCEQCLLKLCVKSGLMPADPLDR